MESQQQSAEPKMYDGNPVAYWAWYRTQPRTRQCSELIERLCLFLSAAAVSVDRMSVVILNQPVEWPRMIPAGCRIPDELIDAAIRHTQESVDAAERAVAKLRGIWIELPAAVSSDPRSWETDLVRRIDQARIDAGAIALGLSYKKELGSTISDDEAQEWRRKLKSHCTPLMEAHAALKAVPPGSEQPHGTGEYQPASWFPKEMAARLRMAARKDRKTKHVATKQIDGVVFYSVADARRWWPKDIPKEA